MRTPELPSLTTKKARALSCGRIEQMGGRGIEAATWGSATRDAEIRTSKAGNEFSTINLMIAEAGADAEGKPTSTFIKALAFGQQCRGRPQDPARRSRLY
jgi:hypothetical protein